MSNIYSPNLPDCRPYLITPPAFDPAAFADLLAAALDAGNINCAQIWMPEAEADEVKRALEILLPICHQRDVALLVCDHVDLVAACGADGVHLARRPEDAEDVSDVQDARKTLGNDVIIGASCYSSRHRALIAADKGADYVSFGPCFASDNTTYTDYLELELLTWWSTHIEIPAVAIGGITGDNCADLIKTGVDFVATSGGVWNHPDGPAKAVSAFNDAIAKAQEEAGGKI
jgi:thiamine-phosphate pyrophosphorylase